MTYLSSLINVVFTFKIVNWYKNVLCMKMIFG